MPILNPKSLGSGLYRDETGAWYLRYHYDRKQRWHKLAAIKERAARIEADGLKTKLALWKAGAGPNPFEQPLTFAVVSRQYLEKGCPDVRGQPRVQKFQAGEKWRIEKLASYYGKKKLTEITVGTLLKYAEWRQERVSKGTGHAAVRLECVTLSNVFTFAVRQGLIPVNLVRSLRPNFTTQAEPDKVQPHQRKVVTCAEVRCESGDEVHKIANILFSDPRSESVAWQFLFETLTGCRAHEVLQWRIDGKDKSTPGFIQGQCLFLRRAKRGTNPYFQLTPIHEDAVRCHRYWLQSRFPESPWWFPGQGNGLLHLAPQTLWHALDRLCRDNNMPHRRGHACRAFYVCQRRSVGITDDAIAAEIGVSDVKLINKTYGDRNPAWGTKPLSFLPSVGLPAWSKYRPEEEKVVGL